jgi:hypothetical protein
MEELHMNVKKILINFLLLIGFTINLLAQADQARIGGTVTDAAGKVIPGATVTVTSESTGEIRNVIAGSDGTFLIAALKPGKYNVLASAATCETLTRKNSELLVGQRLDVDLPLQARGVSASVDIVSGDEALTNVTSASMSANVNAREVEGLPVNGRQLSQLYLQAPGGVNSGTGTFSDIRFSGRANNQNVVRYDGVEGTAVIDSSPGNLNGEVPSPFRLQSSLENVQEFRVDSSNFPAEYGTGTGGQISVVTKSGTNRFHGSGFEFLRRDALDSRNFFDNITPNIPKSALSLDQFGGSVGGPIIKDKLFFFFSYEQYRGRFGLNFVEAAPITNINTLCAAPIGTNPNGLNCQANGAPAGTPSLTIQFRSAFRSPDAVVVPGGTTVPGFEIVQLQALEKTDEKAAALRLDYSFDPMNKVYFRFFRDQGTDVAPEGVSGRVVSISAVPQNGVLGWQSILKQDGSLINEFKID